MSLRPSPILRQLASLSSRPRIQPQTKPWICRQCQQSRPLLQRRSYASQPADDPSFTSIVDVQPQLVRVGGKKHGWGLLVLAVIPITAFALGSWQVQRLGWKTELIARFEDRLVRDPLPLPPSIDPAAIKDFDYRRVYASGKFRHDQEMLIGPRLLDGNDGYMVVTPLEREFEGYSGNTKILICRGWIPKDKANQRARPEGLPQGEVTVQGLLREPWKKNMFTPENKPEQGAFYFPDVEQMAGLTGSQPVWIEETMKPDLVESYDREAKGIPIGRPAEVNLRNNHTQYIFTWYSLAAATSVMLWMVIKKPSSRAARRVRQSGQCDLSHGIFDGSTRQLDRTTNEQLHPFLLGNRLRQRNDLGPDATRLARRSPHQSSASSLAAVLNGEDSPPRLGEYTSHRRDVDQAVFTLPKLPAKRHAKRHRVPPVLQGLHQPPPDAGLLPSISTEEAQVFLSTSRSSKSAPVSVSTDDANPAGLQQEPTASAEATQEPSEKRSRRNIWTEQETNDLLAGVSRFGIGNWKKILLCSDYQFHKRTAVDLKDRFRVCRPDAYGGARKTRKAKRVSSEEAVTGETSKRPKLAEKTPAEPAAEVEPQPKQAGTTEQTLWKAQRRPRRNFTDEEDEALLKGFREQGPSWVSICKDEAFREHGRTPTDLRDRLRTRFPEKYAQAGLASRPAVPKPAKRTRATREDSDQPAEPSQTTTTQAATSKDSQSALPNDRLERISSRTGPAYSLPLPSIGDDSLSNFGYPDDDEDADPIVLDRSIMDWANNNMAQLNRPSHPQISDSLPFPGIDPLVTLKLPKPGFF
ncbi:SURF1 family protein, partial [Aureobasidium melanogenum]